MMALFTRMPVNGGGGAALPRCLLSSLVLLLRLGFLAALSEYVFPLTPLMMRPGVYLPVLLPPPFPSVPPGPPSREGS